MNATHDILEALATHRITLTTGVPDGWITPLLSALEADPRFDYIPAAREEECFGIAAGASMAGQRALVVIQNSGFLNAVGCYTTLCQKYQTPFVCLVAHRGGLSDSNSYDPNKHRTFEAVSRGMNLFTCAVPYAGLALALPKAMARAERAGEPSFVLLTEGPPA